MIIKTLYHQIIAKFKMYREIIANSKGPRNIHFSKLYRELSEFVPPGNKISITERIAADVWAHY